MSFSEVIDDNFRYMLPKEHNTIFCSEYGCMEGLRFKATLSISQIAFIRFQLISALAINSTDIQRYKRMRFMIMIIFMF